MYTTDIFPSSIFQVMPITGSVWLRAFIRDIGYERIPAGLIHKLRCSNLGYRDRVYLASFFYGNGIGPGWLTLVLYNCNTYMNAQKEYKLKALFEYWAADGTLGFERRARYFTYFMDEGRVLSLNRQPRSLESRVPRSSRSNRRDNRGNAGSGYHC